MTSAMGDAAKSKAEQYNAVVAKAKLLSVMLTSCSFKVRHGFHGKEEDASKYLDERCFDANYLVEEHMLLGEVRFRVWMTEKDAEHPEDATKEDIFADAALRLEASYIVAFEIPGEHSEKNMTSFFERTAVFTAWPYFRALVAQFATASEVEIPILPIKQLHLSVQGGSDAASSNSAVESEETPE